MEGIIDDYRIIYLKNHIETMKQAVELDGVELMVYTPWGCIDIVSAGTGDFSRRKKKSFDWYKKVIASNGDEFDL